MWTPKHEEAFHQLKKSLVGPNMLVQPDFNNELILETDACNTGLGAILSQEVQGIIRPIAYASRTLQPAERNYSITEKEMLGALWGMEHFRYFLYGREFLSKTDHKALEAFITPKDTSNQLEFNDGSNVYKNFLLK